MGYKPAPRIVGYHPGPGGAHPVYEDAMGYTSPPKRKPPPTPAPYGSEVNYAPTSPYRAKPKREPLRHRSPDEAPWILIGLSFPMLLGTLLAWPLSPLQWFAVAFGAAVVGLCMYQTARLRRMERELDAMHHRIAFQLDPAPVRDGGSPGEREFEQQVRNVASAPDSVLRASLRDDDISYLADRFERLKTAVSPPGPRLGVRLSGRLVEHEISDLHDKVQRLMLDLDRVKLDVRPGESIEVVDDRLRAR